MRLLAETVVLQIANHQLVEKVMLCHADDALPCIKWVAAGGRPWHVQGADEDGNPG